MKGERKMGMIIGGKEIGASERECFDDINPTTLETIDRIPIATAEDIDRAVAVANEGKRIWKNTPLFRRIEILRRFTELLAKNRVGLRDSMIAEQGKTLVGCEGEIDTCINVFRAYCDKARVYATDTPPLNSEPGSVGDIMFTIREPLGVVVCIVPFNYPVELYAHKVAPALVAGNAVIVKPSSDTPLGDIALTKMLHEAGVPAEALQIVTGGGSRIGDLLSSHTGIDAVSLTGSTDVGIRTALNGAKNLTRVYLELGGNDPLIIFDDCDMNKAVEEALLGRAWNAGQTCCATKRFLVQNTIKDAFTKRLVDALANTKVGDPRDTGNAFGPLISENAAARVEKEVQYTIGQGAECLLGGKRYDTTFFEATVLGGVTPDMDIAGPLEIFGPVFPIIGFADADEAIEIANRTPFGLASGVMTNDMGKAFKVASEIEAGTCVINGSGNYRTAYHAFGGYKMSGCGREGCGYTLDEFTQVKSVVMKKLIG
jgi:succinate-semialdehyde dehydrogenase/glutarate-semialdehyde dehydrogenase